MHEYVPYTHSLYQVVFLTETSYRRSHLIASYYQSLNKYMH